MFMAAAINAGDGFSNTREMIPKSVTRRTNHGFIISYGKLLSSADWPTLQLLCFSAEAGLFESTDPSRDPLNAAIAPVENGPPEPRVRPCAPGIDGNIL